MLLAFNKAGVVISATLCISLCSSDYITIHFQDVPRVVSEDIKLTNDLKYFVVIYMLLIAFVFFYMKNKGPQLHKTKD